METQISPPEGLLAVDLRPRTQAAAALDDTVECLCGELRVYDLALENLSDKEEIR